MEKFKREIIREKTAKQNKKIIHTFNININICNADNMRWILYVSFMLSRKINVVQTIVYINSTCIINI